MTVNGKKMKKGSNQINSDSQTKTENMQRKLLCIDQSHKQVNRDIIQITELLEQIGKNHGLKEPLILKGKPKNKAIAINKKLLPSIVALLSMGSQNDGSFSETEIKLVNNFVKEGGILFLTAYPPFKPPNRLLEKFNVKFINQSIKDPRNHAGKHDDHIIVSDLKKHPINSSINKIRFGDYGCYPIVSDNPITIPLAYSSNESIPPKTLVAAIVYYGKGDVILVGQMRLFQDDFIDEYDNKKWLENILSYFITKEKKETDKGSPEFSISDYCSNCGYKFLEGDIFCGNCGAKLQITRLNETVIVTKKRSLTNKNEKTQVQKTSEGKIRKKKKIQKKKKRVAPVPSKIESQQISDLHIQEVSASKSKSTKRIFLTSSSELEKFKRVLAWNLETNAKSIVALTESLIPFLASHVIHQGGKIKISENTGPASLDLLFNLNYIEIIGHLPFNDFGEVPKSIKVKVSEMEEIKQKFENFVSAYMRTKDVSKKISEAAHRIDDYTRDFGELCRKEDVTNLGKLRKYEKGVKEFIKRIHKTDWSNLPQSDYSRYLSAFQKGKMATFDLSLDWKFSTGTIKTFYRYPFIIYDDFKTDLERYVSPFFTYVETVEDRYFECLNLFKECKDKSGFLKNPPDKLKSSALDALYKFDAEYNGFSAAYNYSIQAYYRSQRIEEHYAKDILKRINRTLQKTTSDRYIKNAEDIIKRIYSIVASTNIVKPVRQKITAR